MNRKIPVRGFLFFLSFLSVGLLVTSRAMAATSAKDVRTIYELSSLEQQALNLGRTFIEEGLATGRQELPDDNNRRAVLLRLEVGLREDYAPERLKAKMFNALTNALDIYHVDKIIEIMKSPVWQRATDLERKANTLATTKKLERYITDKLQKQNPRPYRVDLIRQLVVLSDVVPLMMDLMISASVRTTGMLLPQEDSLIYFEADIRKRVESMQAEYKNMLIQQFLYTYRHMPDEQLKAYVDYYKTPAITNLNRAISQALREAFK